MVGGGRELNTFIEMLKDSSGASVAEYALVLAITGAGIVIASISLQTAISNSVSCTVTPTNAGAENC